MDPGSRPLVVFCDGYSQFYGAQRSLLTLYSEFVRTARYRPHFVHIEDGDLTRAVRQAGIPVSILETGPLLRSYGKRLLSLRWWEIPRLAAEMLLYSRRLRRHLRNIGADLVHCNNDRAGMLNFLGASWAGIPHVNHIRRECSFGRLDRFVYDRADQIIWVSKRVRDDFAQRHGLHPIKGRVIYNARVLPDAGGPDTRDELLAEFGLPGDSLLCITVAGYEESKHHENLVDAARAVCASEPRAVFLLAGEDVSEGGYRRKLIERMISDSRLQDRVRLLGHRDDVGRLMRGADLLVSASRNEALGGALIEAMGYGLPCVATDTGGTSEIVPPDRCGCLVPREDPASLARAVLKLLADPERRREFSENARRHFSATFTVERCAEQTGACFDELLRTRGAVRDVPSERPA